MSHPVMAFYERPQGNTHSLSSSWDVYCLICGGPSLNPAKVACTKWNEGSTDWRTVSIITDLLHLSELASRFPWLDECIGIPQHGPPIALGLYDCQGDFALSGNRLFGPYPSFAQAERTANKEYGLNCHTKCYKLLQDQLGYKLCYQDIWPKLVAANDDSECLRSKYGGITDYHSHAFVYPWMEEDKTGWMLLDPTQNKQNAQRILTVWENVPEVRRLALTAVFCSFKRAAKLTEPTTADKHSLQTENPGTVSDNDILLWKAMAQIPPALLRSIIERAYFHQD